MMTRNSGKFLTDTLDSLALFCDTVFVINDRSTDNTLKVLQQHKIVGNIFTTPFISDKPWAFSESSMLGLLYGKADFLQPDWIIASDDDFQFEAASGIREVLANIPADVAGLKVPLISLWDDPEYPQMIPLMQDGRARRGLIWRYFKGLQHGSKFLHNGYLPINISEFGSIAEIENIICYHKGWNTLQKRIEKVDIYTSIDPLYALNNGVPYDKGLLFGYCRNQLSELISEYRLRVTHNRSHK